MSVRDTLRSLADGYEHDSRALRAMDQAIGYGLTNEQWAIVYRTISRELYAVAEGLD